MSTNNETTFLHIKDVVCNVFILFLSNNSSYTVGTVDKSFVKTSFEMSSWPVTG